MSAPDGSDSSPTSGQGTEGGASDGPGLHPASRPTDATGGTRPDPTRAPVGMNRVLRTWAGDSLARRLAVLVALFGPVLLAGALLPSAIDGALAARVVVGVVVAAAVAYRVVDTRLTLRDDPSRRSP
jgi:hypothetical protein